ncbi:hypothetical protein NX79_08250 [Xanthomonas vasicola]|nr:hypothetical protein NX05_18495 [Xanthomonas vasicola]KGR40701.1 hypothetical protein NX04_15685 [Xanthomonas vasicola]KGR60916.1 hypothetical protein NX79_08250 [Xanthomonas vasicola]
MPVFDPARRQILKGTLGSLSALQSRQAQAATSPSTRLAPFPSRYGPLAPVADQSTGLPLLQLPQVSATARSAGAAIAWTMASPAPTGMTAWAWSVCAGPTGGPVATRCAAWHMC